MTARQLGAAVGVAAFVAVLGGRVASGLAGLDRAWIVVMITAAITAVTGLGTAHRPASIPAAAAVSMEIADDGAAIACGTSGTRG